MNTNKQKTNKGQRGFTLVELLITIAIIALGVLGIAKLANLVTSDNKAGNASRNATALAQNAINLYADEPAFGVAANALSVGIMLTNSKVPTNMINGLVIANAWGGTVVPAGSVTASGSPAVQLSYTLVKTNECSSFVTAAAGAFDEILVAGVLVKLENASIGKAGLGAQCSSAATLTIVLRKVKT